MPRRKARKRYESSRVPSKKLVREMRYQIWKATWCIPKFDCYDMGYQLPEKALGLATYKGFGKVLRLLERASKDLHEAYDELGIFVYRKVRGGNSTGRRW